MLAAIWDIVKHLDAGLRRLIYQAMLVRVRVCLAIFVQVNFAVAGFRSLPILH